MSTDRAGLAHFLRRRREALQPDDVGLPRGQRRRTEGLRREEVALLANMSSDYYARLERERGPQPSTQMLASLAQALRLNLAERDHLFRLAGHAAPARGGESPHISPGMMRIFDRLGDTAAEIVTELGETLRQTDLAVALLGDVRDLSGLERNLGYRWFVTPGSRDRYAPDDHEFLSRLYASHLRERVAAAGPGSAAARLAETTLAASEELRRLWSEHEVGVRPRETKRFVHPSLGRIDVHCQTLLDPEQGHLLLVYTAAPASESAGKLELLSVLGSTSTL